MSELGGKPTQLLDRRIAAYAWVVERARAPEATAFSERNEARGTQMSDYSANQKLREWRCLGRSRHSTSRKAIHC